MTRRLWPADAPCPYYTDGRTCEHEWGRAACRDFRLKGTKRGGRCQTFLCARCRRYVPWCVGMSESDLCDVCACVDDAWDAVKRAEDAADAFEIECMLVYLVRSPAFPLLRAPQLQAQSEEP